MRQSAASKLKLFQNNTVESMEVKMMELKLKKKNLLEVKSQFLHRGW